MYTIQYSEIRFIGYTLHTTIVYKHPRAQNLRQSIVLKTSFKTRVSRMGLEAVLWISIFLQWNIFFSLFTSLIFFDYLKSKSTQMWRSQKENSRFSFYDILRFKFRALYSMKLWNGPMYTVQLLFLKFNVPFEINFKIYQASFFSIILWVPLYCTKIFQWIKSSLWMTISKWTAQCTLSIIQEVSWNIRNTLFFY